MSQEKPPQEPSGEERKNNNEDVEVTPDEQRVIEWYTELQEEISSPSLTEEEIAEKAEGVMELARVLEHDENMGHEFKAEMESQVKGLQDRLAAVRKIRRSFRELRRVVAQEKYDEATRAYDEARNALNYYYTKTPMPEKNYKKLYDELQEIIDPILKRISQNIQRGSNI